MDFDKVERMEFKVSRLEERLKEEKWHRTNHLDNLARDIKTLRRELQEAQDKETEDVKKRINREPINWYGCDGEREGKCYARVPNLCQYDELCCVKSCPHKPTNMVNCVGLCGAVKQLYDRWGKLNSGQDLMKDWLK